MAACYARFRIAFSKSTYVFTFSCKLAKLTSSRPARPEKSMRLLSPVLFACLAACGSTLRQMTLFASAGFLWNGDTLNLRSALVCACLAACCSNLHAAPQLPISAFVQQDEYSKPRLSPDGKHIAITVRIPSGERFVPVVSIFSLPGLKRAGGVRMPEYQEPLNYVWVSNTRLVITKAKEMGSRDRPVSNGEVLATDFDGSKQEYLFGDEMVPGQAGPAFRADQLL
jgi:hypothetical protein